MSEVKDLKHASDEELMLAYRQGQEQAFMLLYERHSGKVYGFLSKHLQDRSLVDDAFQATFLKLHSFRDRYDPTLPFAPWLFTICRSVMIDLIRERARIHVNERTDDSAMASAPNDLAPESIVTLPDFSRLPANQRQALELRFGENLPFEEIAQRLHTTPENTRQMVSRAIRKLRIWIQGEKK